MAARVSKWFTGGRRNPDLPRSLAFLSAALIVLVALLTLAGLWFLQQFNDQVAQQSAAMSVIDSGRHLTRSLAQHAVVLEQPTPREWRQFKRTVAALHAVEPNLQFVSIHRDGVTVFHHHTDPIMQTPAPPLPPGMSRPPAADFAPVRIRRRMLDLGDRRVPVMVFAQDMLLPDASRIEVEVGLKREALDHRHEAVTQAVRSMFRISVAVMITAFGLCLVLISTLVRREQRRETRRRQSEHLAFSGMMANGIAHDFRNPMSSLRLDAQMLARTVKRTGVAETAHIADLADRINRTVVRMDAVFRDFMYLSRPQSETLCDIDLRDGVRESLETLAGRMESVRVRCRETWPREPLRVRATAAALRRALTNILMNALQHSPADGIVNVRGIRHGEWGGVEIQDQGPGISRRDRRRIFDLFYSSRPGGTGLGLFLAKTAIEDCGGRIEVGALPGRGACIRVWLPIASPPTP